MKEFTIRPILGLKTDVPQNDPSLFQGEACHAVDMQNVDLDRIRNASTKSVGKTRYSGQNSQKTRCTGLMELRASTQDRLVWDNGKFYYLASDKSLTNIDAAVAITWTQSDSSLMSAIKVGDYVIMTDRDGKYTPYKWKHGDANLTKLIVTGTEYQFRYLATYQRRIFGAYDMTSGASAGDVSIRWTQPYTESNYWASAATMASGNQLYRPNDVPITGIKPMGSNALILYGDDAIDSIDYFVNYTTPFAINNLVSNQGFVNHHGIVDVGGVHYGFNRNYGFCGYGGTREFPLGGMPISYQIEDKIGGINPIYYNQIVGCFLPIDKEIAWAVPLDGAATPNAILRYDLITKQWTVRKHDCRYIDYWTLDSSIVWNDLAGLGYTTWDDFGTLRWSDLLSSAAYLVLSNADGYVYTESSESDNTADWDGYRVEPIISLGETQKTLLLEIWFGLSNVGNFSLYVSYRSGNTEAECEGSAWIPLPEVSCNSPENAVCRLNDATVKMARFYQIKWGTDAANETFSVNAITFKFVPEGVY